ncbi:MAG: diguanylate cyclase [Myxococcales bacterium]|nr:diguanylate cyclase [Myxococcales bacterium]
MDSDIKTRVTPLDELKVPLQKGQDCLVTIYSPDATMLGKRHVLSEQPILLGRGSENTIVLNNDSVSRRHCRIEKRGRAYYVRDLESTNGTYVNDDLVTDYQMRRGDQVKVGDTIFKFLSGSDIEAQYHETIYRMTIVDGLTGVNNKRFLLEALEKEISRARRHARALSLLMFDIDHFKNINDSFGHLAGDFVLKDFAQLVKGRLRPDDVLGRYGGEEFAVMLPETPLDGACKIAEELREMVATHLFDFEQEKITVTVSVGVAQIEEGWDILRFIKEADEKLYVAKRGGRNKVVS